MKNEYIITNQELKEKGTNLSDYVLDETFIPAIINTGFDKVITRCCELNDNLHGEDDIELELDNNPKLVKAFKKLQYTVIYNLIHTAETSPIDEYVDAIICFELRWGKINGFQKGFYYKND